MITSRCVLDATEEGEFLPLTGCGVGGACGIGLEYRRATRPGRPADPVIRRRSPGAPPLEWRGGEDHNVQALSEYSHRKARAMFHRLVHLPSASPIEVHRRTLVGDPQLLVPSRLPTSGSTTNRRPRPVPLRSRRTTIPGSHGERPVVPRYRSLRVLPDQRGPPGPAKVRYSFNQIVTLDQKLDDGRSSRPAHCTLSQPTPSRAAHQHAALQHPRVIELLAGAAPRKIIVVPGRLVSIVV